MKKKRNLSFSKSGKLFTKYCKSKSQIQSQTVTERLKKDKAGGFIYLTYRKSATDVKNI